MASKLKDRRSPRFSRGTILGATAGALLATFAFSHAAATIGVPLEPFRPLGGNFFAWQVGQRAMLLSLIEEPDKKKPLPLIAFGKTALSLSPLSSRPAWILAQGYEQAGEQAKAHRAMLAAERISRREAGVQMWLAQDDLRNRQIVSAMRRFDVILRTSDSVGAEILPRLAAIMAAPDGRKALQPYARADNPWFGNLMLTAAQTAPKSAPVAQFLVEGGKQAPTGALAETAYRTLMQRLASEGAYDEMAKLYPLLPSAQKDGLRNVSVASAGRSDDYAPVAWDLAAESDLGGALLAVGPERQGLEFYASPGTVGVSGRKLVRPGANRTVRFTILDSSINEGSSAKWVATCAGQKRPATSSAELTRPARNISFVLPAGCELVTLEMRMAGGIGTEPARVVIEDIRLASR